MTLPPGRLKLVTRPAITGSPVLTKTIGISVVDALATGAVGVFAAITATLRRTRSAAIYLEVIVLTLSPLVIHRDVFALDVTGFIESVQESGQIRCVSVW